MALMIRLHHFLKKCIKNVAQDSVSGIVPDDQEGLFKLAIQLRTFFYSAIYNTAFEYVLWIYLTDI
jgi:hypothetical protein